MKKLNLEQDEALQEEFNRKNQEFYETLEDTTKHDAVYNAMKTLTDAGVITAGFYWLTHCNSPDEEVPVQYNNIGEVLELYKGNFVLSDETSEKLSKVNCQFAYAIYLYIRLWAERKDLECRDALELLVKFFESHDVIKPPKEE